MPNGLSDSAQPISDARTAQLPRQDQMSMAAALGAANGSKMR